MPPSAKLHISNAQLTGSYDQLRHAPSQDTGLSCFQFVVALYEISQSTNITDGQTDVVLVA